MDQGFLVRSLTAIRTIVRRPVNNFGKSHEAAVLLIVAFSSILFTTQLRAQDWPQINGPTRNGVVEGQKLLTKWPKDGPKVVWTQPVGQGFSGVAIKDNTLIAFHRPKKTYLVEARAADTGKLIWNKSLACDYSGGGPDGDRGPKAVPLIHKDKVYLFGTAANLFCLNLSDGKVVWEKSLAKDYVIPRSYFGSGSSPIVIGDKLLLNVGGKDAGIVAFNVDTGKEIWKCYDDRASYSSPIAAEIGGKTLAVFVTRLHLIGVDPENGDVVFETRFGKPGTTVNGAMPVFVDGHIFVNSAYGVGARWFDMSSGKPVEVWSNDESFSSQYSTPIFIDGHLYGSAGREDVGVGSFRCVEAATGKVKWQRDNFEVGHTLLVDGKLVVIASFGSLFLIEPSEEKYKELGSHKVLDWKTRAMPAFSNGRIYLRTNASGAVGTLSCIQVGESK